MINYNKIKKLPVQTASGIRLGQVFDLELDGHPLKLTKLKVRLNFLSKNILLIAPEQIIRITKTSVIVQDTLTPVSQETVVEAKTNESFALNSILE